MYLINGIYYKFATWATEVPNELGVELWTEENEYGMFVPLTSPLYTDVINSGIPIRPVQPGGPSGYYMWDDINSEWVINYTLFNPLIDAYLEDLRDQYLNSPEETVTVSDVTTYIYDDINEVWVVDEVDQEVVFGLDARTLNSILEITLSTPQDNEDVVTEYRAKNGRKFIKGETFGRALIMLRNRRQFFFTVQGKVEDLHAVTPFTSLEDVETAYNNLVGE